MRHAYITSNEPATVGLASYQQPAKAAEVLLNRGYASAVCIEIMFFVSFFSKNQKARWHGAQ